MPRQLLYSVENVHSENRRIKYFIEGISIGSKLYLVHSLASLHVKNPAMLIRKEKIVKVSCLNQGVRCDSGADNHEGCINTNITP